MFKPAAIDELVRRLLQQLPAGMSNIDADLRRNLRAALGQVLRDMDLVTREEFDLQTRVLARTREKLERLEQQAAEMERTLARQTDPDGGAARG